MCCSVDQLPLPGDKNIELKLLSVSPPPSPPSTRHRPVPRQTRLARISTARPGDGWRLSIPGGKGRDRVHLFCCTVPRARACSSKSEGPSHAQRLSPSLLGLLSLSGGGRSCRIWRAAEAAGTDPESAASSSIPIGRSSAGSPKCPVASGFPVHFSSLPPAADAPHCGRDERADRRPARRRATARDRHAKAVADLDERRRATCSGESGSAERNRPRRRG